MATKSLYKIETMQREIKYQFWIESESRMIDAVGFAYESKGSHIRIWYMKGERLLNESFATHNVAERAYTGLKDKNGKEIYEGDIVRFIDNPTDYLTGKYEVVIDAGFIGIHAQTSLHLTDIQPNKWCEVIGNIYEHPHLLTPQQ